MLGVSIFALPSPNVACGVSYPHYLREILDHAGVAYTAAAPAELADRLPDLRLLITIGETALPSETRETLERWVENGGGWLSLSGLCGMAALFGAEAETQAHRVFGGGGAYPLGEGYLTPTQERHPVLAHLETPLHFFNGIAVRNREADALAVVLDAHQRPTERPALLERQIGQGRCLLLAPDAVGAVVRIRQGCAVTRDGVPSSDGTAPISDGVLKSDDGCVLDWIFDRQPVPGVPGLNAFLQPIADQWCEILLRSIFHLASALDVTLPVLWLYPRNLPAVAEFSHDSDGNLPDLARLLLTTLAEAEVVSTWCILPEGYPPDVIDAIREAGHELAMHYDAMTDRHSWGEETFQEQYRRLVALFGSEPPVTNKNHYLRWEGDTEFFDWCANSAVQLDQSKGASKTGEAGFNFGTCHPHFPLAPDGRAIDVLELPTPTQDLEVFAPTALGIALLEPVLRSHGVLHLLFHPAHIDKPAVAQAILRMAREARSRGMEWWTALQINQWERARRKARWIEAGEQAGRFRATLRTEAPLEQATLLLLHSTAGAAALNGRPLPTEIVERWGFAFRAGVVDLDAGQEYEIICDAD